MIRSFYLQQLQQQKPQQRHPSQVAKRKTRNPNKRPMADHGMVNGGDGEVFYIHYIRYLWRNVKQMCEVIFIGHSHFRLSIVRASFDVINFL